MRNLTLKQSIISAIIWALIFLGMMIVLPQAKPGKPDLSAWNREEVVGRWYGR